MITPEQRRIAAGDLIARLTQHRQLAEVCSDKDAEGILDEIMEAIGDRWDARLESVLTMKTQKHSEHLARLQHGADETARELELWTIK